MPAASRWSGVVLAAFAGCSFILLGRAVGAGPDPAWILTIESSWVNHGSLAAWWFTWLGYAFVLIPAALALLIVAWRLPQWRSRAIFSIVMLVTCWQAADAFQHFFARPRRLDWVVRHETAWSYPSSHAAIAVGFYLLWSIFILRSTLPRKRIWSAILAAAAAAILWSRLALAAHYLTDVVGGALLAAAIVALAAAVVPINVFGVTARRP